MKRTCTPLSLSLLQASGYTGEREYEFIALVDANGSVIVHSDSGRGDVISQRLPNLDMNTVYERDRTRKTLRMLYW